MRESLSAFTDFCLFQEETLQAMALVCNRCLSPLLPPASSSWGLCWSSSECFRLTGPKVLPHRF